MPSSLSYGRHFVAHEEESPYYPTSPLSPVFSQSNMQQLTWHQSSGDDSLGPTPFIHSKSPSAHTHSSLDSMPSQFPAVKIQQDPYRSFLPPPIQLDTSEEIGCCDNSGRFLSENDNQPQSPFPPRNHGSMMNDAGLARERSFSSPGINFRPHSYGAKSPLSAPPGHILYEDKPLSWNGGSGFPAPSAHMEASASSPSHYDRFNSRPPRHGSTTKDTQALLSPRVDMRHGFSDGNFNMQYGMSAASMSPIAKNNHGRFQSPGSVIGSSSFDSSVQGILVNDRQSLGNMETL